MKKSERKKLEKGVAVKKSSAGLGLFAARSFEKEDLVIEYTGERISTEGADRRGGKYLFILDKKRVIDGKGRENIARYMNHSCRPNCEAEIDEDDDTVYIRARKHIDAGEELTYHYGKAYVDEYIKPFGCRCQKCSSMAS